jgi:hypothetical protein
MPVPAADVGNDGILRERVVVTQKLNDRAWKVRAVGAVGCDAAGEALDMRARAHSATSGSGVVGLQCQLLVDFLPILDLEQFE